MSQALSKSSTATCAILFYGLNVAEIEDLPCFEAEAFSKRYYSSEHFLTNAISDGKNLLTRQTKLDAPPTTLVRKLWRSVRIITFLLLKAGFLALGFSTPLYAIYIPLLVIQHSSGRHKVPHSNSVASGITAEQIASVISQAPIIPPPNAKPFLNQLSTAEPRAQEHFLEDSLDTAVVPTNVSHWLTLTQDLNHLPVIYTDATDVDHNLLGLEIYTGTTVQFSGVGTNVLNWQWRYSVNGGTSIIYDSGTGIVNDVSYYFDKNMVGNVYTWSLEASDGRSSMVSSTNLLVEDVFPLVTNYVSRQVVPAASGALSGFLTYSTTINGVLTSYFYQPLPSLGSTGGGTATYHVTVTNAGDYEIQALVYAPNINANSLLVNIDGQPQNPTMIWDIMPVTSGFEQRLVGWRGNGSENNDQFSPIVFRNLSAGAHTIIFQGREPGTAVASFTLLQLVTQAPSPPSAPNGLRIIPSSP